MYEDRSSGKFQIMKGIRMRKFVIATLLLLTTSPLFAHEPAKIAKHNVKTSEQKLRTEDQKTLYAVGLVLARQLASFNLTPAELRLVKQGLTDGVRGRKPKVDFVKYTKKSEEMGVARRDAHGKKLEEQAAAFIAVAAAEDGAVKMPSGAVYLSFKEGAGEPPLATDTVKLHFKSTLIDGREMDNTYKRGEPENARIDEYVKCLGDGALLMKPGGKARLVCPPETAMGKEGIGLVPPNATLVFDVELVEVVKAK
jgi:FKBP-type peptidyl-prolyl cis-trans isomerase FkpA